MRSLMLLPLLLIAIPAAAQDSDLPPAELPPPPGGEIQAVLVPVNAVFEGLAARDPARIASHLLEGATITVADSTPDSAQPFRRALLAEWIARLSTETAELDERMPNPVVDIDGDVAMVWGFYRFYLNGAFSHCGANHFSLVRQAGVWKIADLAYSRRTANCGE